MSRTRLLSALSILLLTALVVPGAVQAQDGDFPVPPGRILVGDETGLFTIQADGSEKTYLVEDNDDLCWVRDGNWSPDGARLLYTLICGGETPTDWHAEGRTARVFVYDLSSNTSTEVAPNEGAYQDYAGAWHPRLNQIVVYSNRENDRYNLYQIDLDSEGVTQITDYDGDVGRASWDPTGRYLLYNRYVVDTDRIRWEIRALDTDTQNEITVAVGLTPNWSFDGEWIAFVTEGDTADVFIMPTGCIFNNTPCDAETDAVNVTYTPDVGEREPIFSPDQTQLVYLRDTNPEPTVQTWDIYRQEIRTGLLQNLTLSGDVKERHSRWEPVTSASQADISTLLPIVVRVVSGTANLRATDTTNGDIVGVLSGGQIMFVQGANPTRNWYYITLPEDGASAWIFSDLITTVAGSLNEAPEIASEG
ncbi:MAG: PD40 domain-containing protein [Anaerolineae bacterium]|nr:PD40 domain-containing protein [Anaerolineae bacterium]